jgi:hypothetical protein
MNLLIYVKGWILFQYLTPKTNVYFTILFEKIQLIIYYNSMEQSRSPYIRVMKIVAELKLMEAVISCLLTTGSMMFVTIKFIVSYMSDGSNDF